MLRIISRACIALLFWSSTAQAQSVNLRVLNDQNGRIAAELEPRNTQIMYCYQSELRRDSSSEGTIELTVELQNGSVQGINTTSSMGTQLRDCVERRVRSWRFDSVPGFYLLRLRYQFEGPPETEAPPPARANAPVEFTITANILNDRPNGIMRRTFDQGESQIESCYRTELRRDPTSEGTMNLAIEFQNERVQGIATTSRMSETLTGCVERAIRGWYYDIGSGFYLLQVNYRFALTESDEPEAVAVVPAPVPAPAPTSPAPTPPSGVNISATPAFGRVTLNTNFSPDPYTRSLTAGGGLRASSAIPGSCTGYITREPSMEIVYNGTRPLYIYTRGDTDTTLAIRGPNGQWRCSDDQIGTDAGLQYNSGTRGTYDVYVGTYYSSRAQTTLMVSEDGFNQNPPASPPVSTTPPGVNISATPAFGRVTLNPNFSPDPYTRSLTAGGGLRASSAIPGSCTGYITREPTMEIVYNGTRPLYIYTRGSTDTTLAVRGPNGQWRCSDDQIGTNAGLQYSSGTRGTYDVYVGTYQSSRGQTTLMVSEDGFNQNPPSSPPVSTAPPRTTTTTPPRSSNSRFPPPEDRPNRFGVCTGLDASCVLGGLRLERVGEHWGVGISGIADGWGFASGSLILKVNMTDRIRTNGITRFYAYTAMSGVAIDYWMGTGLLGAGVGFDRHFGRHGGGVLQGFVSVNVIAEESTYGFDSYASLGGGISLLRAY